MPEKFLNLSQNLRGILYMLAATLFLTGMATIVRILTPDMHPFEIAFMRNVIGFFLILPFLLRHGSALFMTTKGDLWLMGWRGVFNAVAMILYFLGIALIPLAEVAALAFTTPFFVAILAIFLLKDIPGWRRTASLIAGFIGALIVLRPGVETVSIGSLYVIGSAASWAAAVIIIKSLSARNSSLTITFYALVFLTILTLPPALLVWRWPTPTEYMLLAAGAACGTLGQILFAQSMKSADVSLVMPFDYTKLIWAAIIGIVLFAEVPTIWTLLGGTVIFISSSYLTYRERHAAKAKASDPEAPSSPS